MDKGTCEEVMNQIVIQKDCFAKMFPQFEDMINSQPMVAIERVKAQH